MVGGSLMASASAGTDAASNRPVKATGTKFISRPIIFPPICFVRQNFLLKRSCHRRFAMATHGRPWDACGSGQIVAQQKYDRAKLGFDDRDDLAFGNNVIEF